MTRIVRVFTVVFVAGLCRAATVQAQATTSAAPSPYYVAVDAGATLGHTSDKFIGAEAGMRWQDTWDVFLEGGHMGNVASADLDARAALIANNVGATASAVQKMNFADIGVRYHSPVMEKWDGYALAAVGLAQISTETVLSVNGTAVTSDSLNVAFGADLNGTVRVGLIVFGVGARRDIDQRYFIDLSYRFGRTFAKSDADGNVVVPGLNTQRLQVGVGIHF